MTSTANMHLELMAKHTKNRFSTAAQVAKFLEPFSSCEPVEFNFQRIIRARERLARKLALLRASQSGFTGKTHSDMQPPQADAETMVRDDTDMNEEAKRKKTQ